MPTTSALETVVLRGGVVAPVESLRLLWTLEDNGYQIRLDGDELVISPGFRLTRQQRLALRRHKQALIDLVQYAGEVIV